MIFQKKIEDAYKSTLFVRCDDTGLAHYFSHADFHGLRAEPYSFKSSHGHKLKGNFYSYDKFDADRLIVFEHGFGGGHRSYMREIERLCTAGYRVFAYDHTGCMESGGENAGGFSQSLCDVDDCLKTLKADPNVNTADISVIGHSWGGYSTLNVAALHPDVKRIVVLSGFVSIRRMLEQNFAGILSLYRRNIFALEAASNPSYVEYDALETLKNADVKALLIYSDNDTLIKKSVHYDSLYSALSTKSGVEFMLVSGKGHNPNYTPEAVKLLAELAAAMKNTANIKTDADKAKFRESFDWWKMTEQDDAVWSRILDFLK